jgi:mRNA deadenylase 3'-5' endonuclease subunit Ccr4
MDPRRKTEHLACPFPSFLHPQCKVTVLQFNILADKLGDAKAFPMVAEANLSWAARSPRIVSYITEMGADIVALEEVDHPDELAEALKNTYPHFIYRSKGGFAGDGTMLLYKPRFTLLDQFTKKFTDMEDQSKTASQCFVYAEFSENVTKEKFCVLATHLKAKKPFSDTRAYQAKQIVEFLTLRAKLDSCIVLGDFNADGDEKAIGLMADAGLTDIFETLQSNNPEKYKEHWTTMKYHDAGELQLRSIDYIFFPKKRFYVQRLLMPSGRDEVDQKVGLPDKQNPSDHIPLYAEFGLLTPATETIPSMEKVLTKNILIIKRHWDTENTKACLRETLKYYTSCETGDQCKFVSYNVHLQTALREHEVLLEFKEFHDNK